MRWLRNFAPEDASAAAPSTSSPSRTSAISGSRTNPAWRYASAAGEPAGGRVAPCTAALMRGGETRIRRAVALLRHAASDSSSGSSDLPRRPNARALSARSRCWSPAEFASLPREVLVDGSQLRRSGSPRSSGTAPSSGWRGRRHGWPRQTASSGCQRQAFRVLRR